MPWRAAGQSQDFIEGRRGSNRADFLSDLADFGDTILDSSFLLALGQPIVAASKLPTA